LQDSAHPLEKDRNVVPYNFDETHRGPYRWIDWHPQVCGRTFLQTGSLRDHTQRQNFDDKYDKYKELGQLGPWIRMGHSPSMGHGWPWMAMGATLPDRARDASELLRPSAWAQQHRAQAHVIHNLYSLYMPILIIYFVSNMKQLPPWILMTNPSSRFSGSRCIHLWIKSCGPWCYDVIGWRHVVH
jgi:hypothetical protein